MWRVTYYVLSFINTLTLISLLRENKTAKPNVEGTAEERSYRTRFVFFSADAVKKKTEKKKTKIYKGILHIRAIAATDVRSRNSVFDFREQFYILAHTEYFRVAFAILDAELLFTFKVFAGRSTPSLSVPRFI